MTPDTYLFSMINTVAGRWVWLDFLAIFFAVYSGYVLLGVLLCYLLQDPKRNWNMVVEALIVSLFVRFVLVALMWGLYIRPRPFVNNAVHLLIPYTMYQSSFPSAHASFYFALSTIMYGFHKKVGMIFYGISFLMAVSRVFVGVHWLSRCLLVR